MHLGSENLLLDAPDREHLARERDLAGHGELLLDRAVHGQRAQRSDHSDPRAWTVLRCSAFGDVEVDLMEKSEFFSLFVLGGGGGSVQEQEQE
eukprot:1292304-Rhodomonas_salina.1